MREPAFWRRNGVWPRLLAPVATMYGAVADMRMHRHGASAGVPVLCVGNLTVGGAGKTPTAVALGQMLIACGERPFFLTRGYGGSLAGPLFVQPEHRARQVGDEALLLARRAPTVVARDRVAGAEMAVNAGASVIVMDDGFQNPSLAKDFSLVVIDGEYGPGNGRVFPAGPLRASLLTQIGRADAFLFVGPIGPAARAVMLRAERKAQPVFTGRLAPELNMAARLRGRRVLAFAGIAQPEKFFATLKACEIVPQETRSFADHHHFTAKEAAELLDIAGRKRLGLITTEKDMARIRGDATLARLAAATAVLPVAMTFDDADAIRRNVIEKFVIPNTRRR
jgi:tetraacyldisaccharide 4'-kinase